MLAVSSHVSGDPDVIMNMTGWAGAFFPARVLADINNLLWVLVESLVPCSFVELVPPLLQSAGDVVHVDGDPRHVHRAPHPRISKSNAEIVVTG